MQRLRQPTSLLLAGLAIALMALAATAEAQREGRGRGPRGPGGPGGFRGPGRGSPPAFMLLGAEPVREELKISEDQEEKLQALRDEMRDSFRGARDGDGGRPDFRGMMEKMETETNKILTEDQKSRLQQIQLQAGGLAGAIRNPDVREKMKFTEEQRDGARDVMEKQRDDMEDLRAAMEDGAVDREKFRDELGKLQKEASSALMALLTSEQKEDWKKMTGEPFDVAQLQRGFGGRRGGFGGPGGPGRGGPGRGGRRGARPE